MKICFATNNVHKLQEIQAMLGDKFEVAGLADIGCKEDLPENQETLEGNSLEKARYIYQHYQVNCFADDTGLEVMALNGAPGVYSARYAGPQKKDEDNIDLLLKELKDTANREAQFRTVITLIVHGNIKQFEGIARGTIIRERRGATGFGYDPVFIPAGHHLTFAEMGKEKNKISHRAKAVNKLVDFLNEND